MIIHTCEQRSPEWYAVRCGKVTSSCISDVLAKGKGITRNKYLRRLVAERITGLPKATYHNGAMEWGTLTEPMARDYYEALNFVNVQQVGFVEANGYLGSSPDGFIGEDGELEIKCPDSDTHLTYLEEGRMPSEYVTQVQGQLWITGRKWCDFMSYDPRFTCRPAFIIRVERDEKKIQEIAEGVGQFIDEMKELERRIRNGK
jgi:putative phage-type endonuclease